MAGRDGCVVERVRGELEFAHARRRGTESTPSGTVSRSRAASSSRASASTPPRSDRSGPRPRPMSAPADRSAMAANASLAYSIRNRWSGDELARMSGSSRRATAVASCPGTPIADGARAGERGELGLGFGSMGSRGIVGVRRSVLAVIFSRRPVRGAGALARVSANDSTLHRGRPAGEADYCRLPIARRPVFTLSYREVTMRTWAGKAVSPGYAEGVAVLYSGGASHLIPRYAVDLSSREQERVRLRDAVAAARTDLEELERDVSARLGKTDAAIFATHRAFLDDKGFLSRIEGRLERDGINAEQAVDKETTDIVNGLSAVDDEYLRARGRMFGTSGAASSGTFRRCRRGICRLCRVARSSLRTSCSHPRQSRSTAGTSARS